MSTNEQDLNSRIAAAARARAGAATTPDAGGGGSTSAAPKKPAAKKEAPPDIVGGVVKSLATTARETPAAIWNGVVNAVNEVGENVNAVEGWISKKTGLTPGYLQVGGNEDGSFVKWYQQARTDAELSKAPTVGDGPKTHLGSFIQSATQLGVGIVGVGKLFKGAKATSTVGKIGFTALKGALAEPLVMDAYQQRLSNLIEDAPYIGGPVKTYLAADPNDSLAEAKLKQALEGFVIGVPLEGIIAAAAVVKRSRLFTTKGAKVTPEAEQAIEAALTTVDEGLNSAQKGARYVIEETEEGSFQIIDARPAQAPKRSTVIKEQGLEDIGDGTMYRTHTITLPEGKIGGFATKDIGDNAVQVSTTRIEDAYKGKGYGRDAYDQLTDKVLSQGKQLWSDTSVSEDAARLYESLKKRGYTVEKHPNARLVPLGNGNSWITNKGSIPSMTDEPVFKVTKGPAADAAAHPVKFESRSAAEAEAGMLNTMEVENLRANKPGTPFSPQQIEAYRQTAGKLDGSEEFQQLLDNGGTDFNFHRINGQEDVKLQLETLAKIERKALDEARGGAHVSHEETIKIAQDLFPGDDPEQFVEKLAQVYDNTQDLAAHLLAGKKLMIVMGRRVSQLSTLADEAPESALGMARLGDALEQFFHVTSKVKSIQTNAARAVEIGKVDAGALITGAEKNAGAVADKATSALERELSKVGPQAVAARKVLATIHNMTFEEMRTMARRIRFAEGDPTAILAAVQSVKKPKVPSTVFGSQGLGQGVMAFNEYWINSILSGTKTWAVNTTSNAVNAFVRPVETFNSGLYQIWKGEIKAGKYQAQEGWDLLWGNIKSIKDSLSLAKKSLMMGESILDPGSMAKSESSRAFIGGDIGTLVRLPSRMLMATDEFYKQMAYRSNIRAGALKEARDMGIADIEGYVKKKMDAAFMGDRGLNQAGLNYAKDLTFTKSLTGDLGDEAGLYAPFASRLQDISNSHPLAKVIMPFVQTPTNILHWTWERTPVLRMANRSIREDLKAGGPRAAMAQAKLGTGMALWTVAAGLAATGLITGRGPSNPALREQWLETHQPYSINIDGKWVDFRRGDPTTGPMQMAADFAGIVADTVQASGEVGETDISDIALAAVTALANSFTSKTYLTGVINAMDAFTSNSPNRMDNFFKQQVGTLVPNFFNQTNIDEGMRETRSYVDAMLNRMPGFSEQLPPRHNLFGEPVLKAPGLANRAFNPFTVSGKSDGVLEQKLLALGKAMPMPSSNFQGLDFATDKFGLTKDGLTPYDRMLQLLAQPKGMPTLRKALTDVTSNPGWNSLPDSAGVKYDMVSKVVQNYRKVAFEEVQKEFPLLRRAVAQQIISNRAQKVQGDDGVRQIQQMFQIQ